MSVSVRGNEAEPGVNTLHVHTLSGTVSDKAGSLKSNGVNRAHMCAVSFIGFSHAGSLRVHKMVQTEELPHVFQLCGKGFVTGSELKKHRLSHTGKEKPHMCNTCGKGHIQRGDVQRHLLTDISEKPFCCTYCGEGFTNN